MLEKLNILLSDLVVEYHKLQNFHWYVKGSDFFTAHAKLEELYNYINEAIDEVAENILMLNGKPAGSLKEFLELFHIQEVDDRYHSSHETYKNVIEDFQYLLDSLLEIKKQADKDNQVLISSLMDNYIGEFYKTLWMLRQAFE